MRIFLIFLAFKFTYCSLTLWLLIKYQGIIKFLNGAIINYIIQIKRLRAKGIVVFV